MHDPLQPCVYLLQAYVQFNSCDSSALTAFQELRRFGLGVARKLKDLLRLSAFVGPPAPDASFRCHVGIPRARMEISDLAAQVCAWPPAAQPHSAQQYRKARVAM